MPQLRLVVGGLLSILVLCSATSEAEAANPYGYEGYLFVGAVNIEVNHSTKRPDMDVMVMPM